jgi:hypothetical protein
LSSHREAPEISKDPVADSSDLYAFVSPDKPDSVTLIANYIPLEAPAGGPNFFEFGNDVMYSIYIDNNGDAKPDITYTFQFSTKVRDKTTFLYNVGPIGSLGDKNWNRPQTYSVWKTEKGKTTRIGQNLACPPCNIGPRSTPSYAKLAHDAIHKLSTGETVFAGQRREGFYVDLGSIFDLADLRPFSAAHLLPPHTNLPGVDTLANSNVHSIALQIPIADVSSTGKAPTSPTGKHSVVGVWTSASRRKSSIREANGKISNTGPYVQVSRLGNPLINEVIIPMEQKDMWNATSPSADSQYASTYAHPVLQAYLVALYPGVFPNLGKYKKARADLQAILLTGIPAGVVSAHYSTYTGPTQADLLRLNMAITPSSNPSVFGVLGGDLAGWPNGRRVYDDTVTIALRCVAGASIPLVDSGYSADGAATAIYDVTAPAITSDRYLSVFPYLGLPLDGYDTPSS